MVKLSQFLDVELFSDINNFNSTTEITLKLKII